MYKKTHKSSVRIIGGTWRRRKIHFPRELGLRPTGDRIRETLFNWLQPNIVDAKIYVENDVNASELRVPKNWSQIRNQVAGQVRFVLYSRKPI